MVYTVSKQLTPPTCITHSLKCHFTSSSKLDLVLIKGNILFCYRIYTTKTSSTDENTVAKLELLHEFTLQGMIKSMEKVRTRNSNKDSLLLTFADAKMSLIEYSVFTQNLVTISMHNYDREEFKRDIGYKGTPVVRVDHQSRCAVLHFYRNFFAILPFKHDSNIGLADEDEEKRKYPFLPSYVETEMEKSIRNVIDFKFLYGYLEPTLAILYEPVQTFVGRLANRKDTVSLIVISLDLHQKTYPVLYKVDGLPYNCTHLEAAPAPLGGVLIFSHNALIHLDQTHTPGFAAIVNPFFDIESHFKATPNLDGTPVIPVKNKPPSVYIRTGKTSNCKELGVSLDGCHSTFLSPDIVLVILKTGEMLQVDLIGDENAGRSWKRKRGGVRDIKIKKLGVTTSSPSCITPLADFSQFMKPQILSRISTLDGARHYSNFFFVGSIISDAMLIQYFQPIEEKSAEGASSSSGQDVDMLDDELDEELYGGAAERPKGKESDSLMSANFKFKVCDTILVAGPIRNIAVGKPAPYTSNEYVGEPLGGYLEIVACGGYDTHGSLLVMHESVRPQIISSFPLGDADDIWSVRVSATEQSVSEQYHKYLVISRGSGTSVLRTGEELEELENSGFYVEGPTVTVGTALNESVVVQVYPNGIIILSEDGKRMSETTIGNEDVWIVSCFLNDPYAAILLNTGELQLLLLSNSNDPLRIEKELKMSVPIACIALYTDNSPVQHFPSVREMDARPIPKGEGLGEQSRPAVLHAVSGIEKLKKASQFDDDDMDLYGDALIADADEEAEEPTKSLFEEEDEKEKMSDIEQDLVREAPIRHWCFVVDDAGTLRILSMPDLVERFIFFDFRLAPRFVYDHVVMPDDLETEIYPLQIDEIVVVDLGSDAYRNYPYVIFRTNKSDVFLYRIIPSIEHTPGTNDDRISIRMVRIEQNYISREPQAYADAEGDKLNPIDPPAEPPKFIKKMNLIPFDRIGVEKQQLYAGVVVTGARPMWIMMEYSGVRDGTELLVQDGYQDSVLPPAPMNASNAIRIHPMSVDGQLSSFAPIHNINIPFGFAYINGKGLFRLCQLSPHFSYDRHWPVCKVPLGRSAHKISYHSVSETYILGTSTPTVFEIDKARYMAAVAAGVIADGEELPDSEKKVSGILDVIEDREPGMYLPEISAYQLELISPVTWETVDIIKMSEFEQILAIQVVELASKENTSGKKLFVAIGTGFMRSEDLSCRGRLLVYDVIDVVPEPGRPQTNHKLKPFFSTDEKNPVTAICGCNGYLLAAIGTKILMYAMEDGELNGVAFLDVSIFVVSLSAAKNFIVIGDAFKSVWFVVFQEDPPKLVLLGKDLYPVHTFGCDMIVGEKDLGMVVSDDQNNLHVLTYEPYAAQSLGGNRLLRRGEMNLGYEIQAFSPVKLKISRSGQTGIKTGLVAGTSEGGLSMVATVDEKLFKRLYSLYSRMVTHLEHYAGLNPRGFRQIKLPYKSIHAASFVTGPPGPRGILDGDLLERFLHLPLAYQRELAKAIGSRDDRVQDDLLEIAMAIEYF